MLGQSIIEKELSQGDNQIPISNLAKGIYFIVSQNNNQFIAAQKFVVQ